MTAAVVVVIAGAIAALRTAATRRPQLAPAKAKAHRSNR